MDGEPADGQDVSRPGPIGRFPRRGRRCSPARPLRRRTKAAENNRVRSRDPPEGGREVGELPLEILAALGGEASGRDRDRPSVRASSDDPDLPRGPVEAEEEARQQEGAAEPDERGPRVAGRLKDRELGGRVRSRARTRGPSPLRGGRARPRDTGRRSSRNRRRSPSFRPSMRTAGLFGSDERVSARPSAPMTRSGTKRSTVTVVPSPASAECARLEDDPLQERRVIFPADAQADLGILPVPSVARLIEATVPFQFRGWLTSILRVADGNAVLEHRDRARPVLDAPAGIIFGLEAVEPDRRRRRRGSERTRRRQGRCPRTTCRGRSRCRRRE